MSSSRAQEVADALLERIVNGDLAPGSELEPEATIAEDLSVSRLTAREALKLLQSQGVVRAVHGKRGVVNPVNEWSAMAPIIRAVMHRLGEREVSRQLVEMREIIEVGAAGLAADRRAPEHLDQLRTELAQMKAANLSGDLEEFVRADIAFHNIVFASTGNEFIRRVFDPIQAILLEGRRETSAVHQVQINAIAQHERVLAALEAGSAEAARRAMGDHMAQTAEDLRDLRSHWATH
ncbi:FadR family transcriptional regulator [Arsenicicoccus piscis]|uniref:Transcriptional regulator n=1 Tax=Arsenicicoccus piscis TaxID=673954 RepID=A0ABQ6HSU2_9MICO|nr:FadR/GntR family transcriptional regulator [Arsenicicoccus piscis]MCH8626659.1 FadR family transcriptional regulator [Arsenicicoccus piscis]GMA21320.1 transcriptional regulator [Arsenicicoccus piscis]